MSYCVLSNSHVLSHRLSDRALRPMPSSDLIIYRNTAFQRDLSTVDAVLLTLMTGLRVPLLLSGL